MNTIDWSNQPKDFPLWLEGKGEHKKHSGWYRRRGEVFEHENHGQFRAVREGQFFTVHTKPEWNGEGLPPVDTFCERSINPSTWKLTRICGHSTDGVYAAFYDGDGLMGWDDDCKFRPIRTPEQIAEEERIAGLNEMIRHMKDHPLGTHGVSHLQELMIHEDVARDLWEAGYRKQEAK